jgi:HK97 family phage prohead protease
MTLDVTQVGFTLELRHPEELKRQRILTALVVPYGETSMMTSNPKGERFLPGAFAKSAGDQASAVGRRIKLFRNHDHSQPIGVFTRWDDTPEGLVGEARIAEIPAGDQTIAEIDEGLLDQMSVGFHAIRERKGRGGVREVIEARLLEASVLALGAYEGATVLGLRSPSGVAVDVSRIVLPPAPPYRFDEPLRPW